MGEMLLKPLAHGVVDSKDSHLCDVDNMENGPITPNYVKRVGFRRNKCHSEKNAGSDRMAWSVRDRRRARLLNLIFAL